MPGRLVTRRLALCWRSVGPLLALLLAAIQIGALVAPGASAAAAANRAQPSTPRVEPQIIARGTAPMPAVPVAWRIVTNLARPVAEAPMAERSLGFLLADEDPLTVNAPGSGFSRLSPGQALFVPRGTVHQRTSNDAGAVPYHGLELVVEDDLRADYSLGNASLRYAGQPFTPPAGERDLVLSRYDLEEGEQAFWEDPTTPVLALVTGGEVQLVPVGAGATVLEPGEAASFTHSGGAVARGGPATVITARVLAAGEPQTTGRTGAVGLSLRACAPGVGANSANPANCSAVPELAFIELFVLGTGENRRTLADADEARDGTWTWTGLPFGDYLLQATNLGPGYDRYLVPTLDGLNRAAGDAASLGPNEGFLIPLSVDEPAFFLDLYALGAAGAGATAGPGSADLGVWVWSCPRGVVAQPDMRDLGCEAVDPLALGFEVRLTTPLGGLSLADNSVRGDAGARLWERVPLGDYVLVARLPSGFDGYAARSYRAGFPVSLMPDGTGYRFAITDALFLPGEYRRVNLDLYLLRT